MRMRTCALIAVPFLALTLIAGCSESGVASASAASARSKKSLPAPASPAESPEQAVLAVAHGIADGRLYVAWDALPESYQDDVTALVHGFAGKVDRDLWNRGFALVAKVGQVMKNKKEVILAMPKVRETPGFDADRASREWHRIVAPFVTIANSELADVDALKRIDIRQFLGTTCATLIDDLQALSAIAPEAPTNTLADLKNAKATLIRRDGETAIVRIEVPGEEPREEAFVRVERKWIPQDMADEWADHMRQARAKLAQMSTSDFEAKKPQIMQLLTTIDGVLDQLNEAKTPQQFEQTLQMGMFQTFGGLMALSQESQ